MGETKKVLDKKSPSIIHVAQPSLTLSEHHQTNQGDELQYSPKAIDRRPVLCFDLVLLVKKEEKEEKGVMAGRFVLLQVWTLYTKDAEQVAGRLF